MENISEGYIARDKNGSLFLYEEKPDRDNRHEVFVSHGDLNYYEIEESAFPEVKWESEPKKVQVIIKEI